MNLCLRFTAWLIGVIIQFTISRVSSLLGMMLYWICALLSIKTTLHFSFCFDMSKVAKTVVSTFVQTSLELALGLWFSSGKKVKMVVVSEKSLEVFVLLKSCHFISVSITISNFVLSSDSCEN